MVCLEEEYYRGFGGQPGILPAWLAGASCGEGR